MAKLLARKDGERAYLYSTKEVDVGEISQWALRTKLYFEPQDGMGLRVVDYAPGHIEPEFSHNADELIYILDGEMTMKGETYHTGDALYVQANAVCGPIEVGPPGLRFLRVAAPEFMQDGDIKEG
jgi:quercetin dioxygenase-like cupin family protein